MPHLPQPSPAMSHPPRTKGITPTVLLVHGGFSDGSVWAGVIAELQAAGIEGVALANPLRSLAADAAYVAGAAGQIDGPVLLAGHCYGGAVVTAAGTKTRNAVGLVYVAAFALDEGESSLDMTGSFPGSQLLPVLRPVTFASAAGDPAVELYIDRAAFPAIFAADLPGRVAAAAAAAQRPIAAAAFEEKSQAAAWKEIPSWYVVAAADRMIPPAAQQFMARRAGAHAIEVRASHAVTLAQPAAVAAQIAAASAATRTRSSHPT